MRFAPNRGFLYPVLGQREYNYPGKTFDVEMGCEVRDNALKFYAHFALDVDYINSLIDGGRAQCIVWVYCGATSYRRIFRAASGEPRKVEGELRVRDLHAQLELHPQVAAVEELDLPYDDAHQAFGEGPANLSPGNLVAVHKPSITNVEEMEDRSAKSIFQISKDLEISHSGWDVQIDTGEPFITLVSNKDTYDNFEKLRNNDSMWAVQTLYLSALVETLQVYLADYDSENSTGTDFSTWVGVISSKLQEHNILVSGDPSKFVLGGDTRPMSVLRVAQQLLAFPLFVQNKTSEETDD